MKILILEDNPERVNLFKKRLSNHELLVFDNVKEAIEATKTHKKEIEVYFLDHDLDGKTYVESTEENTGFKFAQFLVENYIDLKADVIIHSMNPVGASNIKGIIPHATITPFWGMIKNLRG